MVSASGDRDSAMAKEDLRNADTGDRLPSLAEVLARLQTDQDDRQHGSK